MSLWVSNDIFESHYYVRVSSKLYGILKQACSTMSITRRVISSNYPISPPRATSTINPTMIPTRQAPIFVPKNSPDFKKNHQGTDNNPCKGCDADVKHSQSSGNTNNVKPGTIIDCKLIQKHKSASKQLIDSKDVIDELEEHHTILGMCKKKDNLKVKSDVKSIDACSLPKAAVKPACPPKVPIKSVESKTPNLPNMPVKPVCPPKEPVKSINTPKAPIKPIESKTTCQSKAPVKSIETKPACPPKSPAKPVDSKTTSAPKALELPVKSKAACSPKAPVKPIQSKMGCPPMASVKPINPNKYDKSAMSKTDRCTTMTIKPITSKQSCVPQNNKESCISNEVADCDQTLVISISLGPKPVITITYDETVTGPLSKKDTLKDFNAEPKKCN